MSTQFKTKSDIHIQRKIFHIFCVGMIFLVLSMCSQSLTRLLAIPTLLIGVGIDLCRLRSPQLEETMELFFGRFMRESERTQLTGLSGVLIGVFISLFLFSKPIVEISVLFLAFADPIASWVGTLWGKKKIIGSKSWIGSFSAFSVCALLASLYFNYYSLFENHFLLAAILAGLIGALSELIPIGPIDDNLTQPLLSGTLLTLLFYGLGG